MSMRASAARYARALLDVAITESDPERAEQELATFVDLVRTNPDLQRTLANPVVSAVAKRAFQAAIDPAADGSAAMRAINGGRDRSWFCETLAGTVSWTGLRVRFASSTAIGTASACIARPPPSPTGIG